MSKLTSLLYPTSLEIEVAKQEVERQIQEEVNGNKCQHLKLKYNPIGIVVCDTCDEIMDKEKAKNWLGKE